MQVLLRKTVSQRFEEYYTSDKNWPTAFGCYGRLRTSERRERPLFP